MQYVIVLVVVAGAFYVISGPLRVAHRARGAADEVPELEAARDAKYREIRDAEMDLRTGKLSDDDYQAIDETLRAEAIEILRRLDAAGATADRPGDGGQRLPSAP